MKAWHWPSFYNVVTGKTLALPNLIALQHIPLSPGFSQSRRCKTTASEFELGTSRMHLDPIDRT